MALRRGLLLHQLLLAVASASLLVAAGRVDPATPPFPDDAGASPADDSSCAPPLSLAHATPPCRDDDAGAPIPLAVSPAPHATPPPSVVFRGSRRLGHHVLLPSGAPAPAPAPAPNQRPKRNLFLEVLLLILALLLIVVLEVGLVCAVICLVDRYGPAVADKYAAARNWCTAARRKASQRVHPAAQQDDAAAAGP